MVIRIINILAFVIMILVNYLANALPLGGKTTGELSAQYPNLFVPAGITFSIWGVIYLLLLVFCIIQFREQNRDMITDIGWLFVISSLLNSAWIFAWHYENPGFSVVIMILLLASLVVINQRITPYSSILTKAAFGIYLGWICIATIANITAFLVAIDWGGWGLSDQFWAAIMVLAGTVITILVLRTYHNIFPGLAVIWALAGIIIARWPDYLPVILAALVGIVIVAVFSTLLFLRTLN